MITVRRGDARGHFDFGWLDTRHSFSFGEYFDAAHTQFRALRVLNEDRVQPGQGFGTHGHRDMEILTWVLSGSLAHQDSLGTQGVIRPGEAQVMSAGTGIRHSEHNASATEPVHFLQIWILPASAGLPPRYGQAAFTDADLRNRWCLIAGPEEGPGAVKLFQDVRVSAARLDAGKALAAILPEGRFGYLHAATGAVRAGEQDLGAGDALRMEHPDRLTISASVPSELLFFDLG